MKQHLTHDIIKQTVNTALSDLKGTCNLAESILKKHPEPAMRLPLRLLAAASFLLLLAVTALAFAPSRQKTSPEGFWKYEGGQLTYQGLEDKYPRTILKTDDIAFMAPDTDNTGTLYYITNTENGRFLNTVTMDGYAISSPAKLDSNYTVRDLQADGSMCYMLADTDKTVGKIIRTNVFDPSLSEYDFLGLTGFQNESVSLFAVYDRMLLAYKEDASILTAIDLSSMKIIHELCLEDVCAIQVGNKYSDIHPAFALTDGGKTLMRIDLETGKTERVTASMPEDASGLQRNKYTLYITSKTGERISSHDLSDLSGQRYRKTLTLVNILEGSPAINEAIRLFNEKYPDIEVITRIIDDYRVAATELMAGEGGIDVLNLTGSWSVAPLPKLVKNGAIADLTDNEHMLSSKDGMRNIWGLSSESGRIYGAVSICEICMWEVNPVLKNKLGWTPPAGRWTLSEFKILADRVTEYNKTADRHMYLLADSGFIPNLIELYNAKYLNTYDGTVSYQTEEFIEILDFLKYLHDNRLLYAYPKGIHTGTIGSDDMVSNALLRVNYMSLGGYGEREYILPPTYRENDPLVAQTYVLVANNNSEMREEAAYFVSLYASKAVTRHQFYLNYGQFIDNKDDYVYINLYDIRKTSPENEEKWNYALEHAESNHAPIALNRIINAELLPAYLDGSISAQEFARILQMQAEMMLGE